MPARGSVPADSGYSAGNAYPFISFPVVVDDVIDANSTMSFTGGSVTVEIYADADNPSDKNLVQTIVIDVPAGTFPIPTLVTTGTTASYGASSSGDYYYSSPTTKPEYWWTFSRYGALYSSGSLPSTGSDSDFPFDGTVGRVYGVGKSQGSNGSPLAGAIFRVEDVVRTLMPYHGDYRLVAASPYVDQDANGKAIYQKHAAWNDTTVKLAHTFQVEASSNALQHDVGNSTSSDTTTPWKAQPSGKLVAKAKYNVGRFPDGPFVFNNTSSGTPSVAAGFATTLPETYGDWDNGVSVVPDGAYINKPDEGNDFRNLGSGIPYFDVNWAQQSGGITLFSPNRQIPSAGMFGSLPTGVKAGTPWQTLLFRPDLNGTHPGARTGFPKDHLFLDLFWMPMVEPYAISEPFSTAGKINMNYQIMPFTYIERSTALRALLRSERVTAIPFASASLYKNNSGTKTDETRQAVNADGTLAQFRQRFETGDIFRSASEICDVHIVPASVTALNYNSSASVVSTRMKLFWNTNRLTGDNVRERPYTTLYPRLTTKSNTYTVHYRVQSLQQAATTRNNAPASWAVWNENTDVILSESRGSTTLERYIDSMDSRIADFGSTFTNTSTDDLDAYTRYRVINSRKFMP